MLTDDQLDLLVIAIQALAPHQPDASSHDLAAVDQGREILRNALARWGSGQVILDNSAPAPAVEVTDLRRTADLLEQHQPAPAPVTEPTDEQLLATVDAVTVTLPPLPMDHTDAHGRIEYDIAWRIAMARAALARWGGQAAPVPVAERLPGAEDCDAEGRCWWGFEETDDYEASWTLRKMIGLPFDDTHWLPATALPLPAGEVQP